MTARNPGQPTHLPPRRKRDTAQERAQKVRAGKRLAARGVVIRPDIVAWWTLDELARAERAVQNAFDRFTAERFDYEEESADG